MSCGCGRSPTGKCIGWHKLTEEQYRQKLADYNAKQKAKEHGGPSGAEPTRYGTWENKGKEVDF